MMQFLVKLGPKETSSSSTTSYVDFQWGQAWNVWSEVESWRETHGHVFISPSQGTVKSWLYVLHSLWMLWELSPQDHWHQRELGKGLTPKHVGLELLSTRIL